MLLIGLLRSDTSSPWKEARSTWPQGWKSSQFNWNIYGNMAGGGLPN